MRKLLCWGQTEELGYVCWCVGVLVDCYLVRTESCRGLLGGLAPVVIRKCAETRAPRRSIPSLLLSFHLAPPTLVHGSLLVLRWARACFVSI